MGGAALAWLRTLWGAVWEGLRLRLGMPGCGVVPGGVDARVSGGAD
ncbi:hypothetical protein DFR72_11633 [Lentzea flaviverrucosa]|uniref:Uncharacterized protein n=1 Tax=Lentzea flaviverrucosa TaxID=200379 RepID=A0A1H9XP79_9PSEU|nr:hypothetical protein DFR72_11633 [Lentzea flaviverrucosa]SES47809.1 hypothetical protein SAMN05216195_11633 [Lentzea flaviverrucosa]